MSGDIKRSLKNHAIESNFLKSTLNSKLETKVIQSPLIEINTTNIAKVINSLYARAETAVRLDCYEDADGLADRADDVFNTFMRIVRRKYRLTREYSTTHTEKPAKQILLPKYAWPSNCANLDNISVYKAQFTCH